MTARTDPVSPCPAPPCPVAAPAALACAVRLSLPKGTGWVRCYDGTWGYDEPNHGFGDTRFVPFTDAAGQPVPTMYLAENDEGALLETVFHDVKPDHGAIYEDTLRGRLLTYVTSPADLNLVDLTDPSLVKLGVSRSAISASGPEHYECTRVVAKHFYDTDPNSHGLIWHSRQAEFQRSAGRAVQPSQVAVVFTDRVNVSRGGWSRTGPQTVSLGSGQGRTLVDGIAVRLDVDIVTG